MAISDFLTPEQANLLLDQQFSSPQGIARLNPLAFRYQNALYPGYEDFYKPQPDFINAPQDDYASLYSTQPDFINAPQDDYASLYYNQLPYSGVGDMGYTTPRTITDQNKVLGQTFTEPKKSNGIMDAIMSVVIPGYNFIKNIAKGGQPYEQFSPGTTIRNGIVSVAGVNTPYSAFGGDFYNPNTGLNRFDRAAQRFEKTGSMTDLFASSRTGKEFFEKRRQKKAAERKALEDAAAAKIKFQTYTSGGGDRDPGPKFDTSGAAPGTSLGSGQFKSSSNPRGRKDY